VIDLRPLTEGDIPNLPQIRPTFRSETILRLERSGGGGSISWRLREIPIEPPYDRGTGYDFDDHVQAEIRGRLARPDECYLYLAEDTVTQRLVGLVDVQIQDWNNSAFLHSLMIDQDYRRQGIGRRLWVRAKDFARRSRVRALLVETQNTNVPACRFYEQMGCALCGLNEALYFNPSKSDTQEIALFWVYPFHSDYKRSVE